MCARIIGKSLISIYYLDIILFSLPVIIYRMWIVNIHIRILIDNRYRVIRCERLWNGDVSGNDRDLTYRSKKGSYEMSAMTQA